VAQNKGYDAKIGDLVYKPFDILKPGKIMNISTKTIPRIGTVTYATVKFLDGRIEDIDIWDLNDFDYATEKHYSKYLKFDKLRREIKKK